MEEETAARSARMTKLMLNELGTLSKAFYERFGAEALPIITEVVYRSSVESGKIIQEMMPFKGMKDVAEFYKMMATRGMTLKVIEVSDNAIRLRIPPGCPLGIEGTSKELCEAMMTCDKAIIGTVLGQEVEMDVVKSQAAGDEICELIYSLK
jgi:predicted hydrocarbon binding protein